MIDRDKAIQSHRRLLRYVGYDYAQPGAYFVTIVTRNRSSIFGEIVDGRMILNKYGAIVANTWKWLAHQYVYVDVDAFIVMPNHFHGILQIKEVDDHRSGGSRPATTKGKIKPLGQLIGVLKTCSAKLINLQREAPGTTVWQRNYYEHIIRNEHEMNNITQYILSNPENWSSDTEFIPEPIRNIR